ncbi:hypothetical protein FQR65_LT03988 [Abscondita terminalis]|nr:hypothetical protein FQR65_LT03988 [Abscondita terminalis]
MPLRLQEAVDIIAIYFECLENATIAARLYALRYPQRRRTPKGLNKNTARQLKESLKEFQNQSSQEYLERLPPTVDIEYALWTGNIREANDEWSKTDKEKSETFADYLEMVFKQVPKIVEDEHREI